jgi:ATP-binding cassette subfamily F protein 3
MLELTADRLVLVNDGTAREFAGSLEDYTDLILGKNQPRAEGAPKGTKKDRKAAAAEREQAQMLRKQVSEQEAAIAKLNADRSAIDLAMFDPGKAEPRFAKLTMGDLMRRRADVEAALEEAEARWMEASEKLEQQQQAA